MSSGTDACNYIPRFSDEESSAYDSVSQATNQQLIDELHQRLYSLSEALKEKREVFIPSEITINGETLYRKQK